MTEYHKILNVFKRDEKTKKLIQGDYANKTFRELAKKEWIATEKIDGTNTRIIFNNYGLVGFKGRTEKSILPENLVNHLEKICHRPLFSFNIRDVLKQLEAEEIIIYGEGFGGKIQAEGHLYAPSEQFIVFDIQYLGKFLPRSDVCFICGKIGLPVVPILLSCTLEQIIDSVKKGIKSNFGDFTAEGVVATPAADSNQYLRSERVITKIKTRDF